MIENVPCGIIISIVELNNQGKKSKNMLFS